MRYGPSADVRQAHPFMESMGEKKHVTLQNAEAVQMVRDFCERPEQHMLHPMRLSNSIIMSLRTLCPLFLGPVFAYLEDADLVTVFGNWNQAVDTPHVTKL